MCVCVRARLNEMDRHFFGAKVSINNSWRIENSDFAWIHLYQSIDILYAWGQGIEACEKHYIITRNDCHLKCMTILGHYTHSQRQARNKNRTSLCQFLF